MTRQPTVLQDRVLLAVWHGLDPFLDSAGVHRSAQVVSRAINLCRANGWLVRSACGVLRLATAGVGW